MKELKSKITVTNASHEIRVKLRPDAKLAWDRLKRQATLIRKQPLSDSYLFNQLLADLTTSLPIAKVKHQHEQ